MISLTFLKAWVGIWVGVAIVNPLCRAGHCEPVVVLYFGVVWCGLLVWCGGVVLLYGAVVWCRDVVWWWCGVVVWWCGGVVVWCCGGVVWFFLTDNNTTPTKLFYIVLLVGLWQQYL